MTFLLIGLGLILAGIVYLMFFTKRSRGSIRDWSQNLSQDKYDPNMTRFRARKETKASAARSELLTNVHQEVSKMADILVAEGRAKVAQMQKEMSEYDYALQRQRMEKEHEVAIASLDNQKQINDMAARFGLSPADYGQLVLEQAKMRTTMEMENQRMLLEVEKDKRLKFNETEHERILAGIELEVGDIANNLEERNKVVVSNMLKEVHHELEDAKNMEDGELKKLELQRLENMKATLEETLRETNTSNS